MMLLWSYFFVISVLAARIIFSNILCVSSLLVVSSSKAGSDSSVGLGVAVGILAFVCVGTVVIGAIFYKKLIIASASKIFR